MDETRTKIVATLGPASGSPDMVHRLIRAGVDVFRLNFSHGDDETHAEYIANVREAAAEFDHPVAVLQDLQGPRIRTGALQGGGPVSLEENAEVTLRYGDFEGDAQTVPVNYRHLAEDVEAGDHIMLSDGLIELEVRETREQEVRCRVLVGAELGENQGINLPGVRLSISSPTPRDLEDLEFGLEHGVDMVALSFVQSAGDVLRLRSAVREIAGEDCHVPIIPKIEKPEAVENLREILLVSDGVMVARGDLGIEMPTEAVPAVQKEIIRTANRLARPVITATQMLESMVDAPRPTRAEASDVANAILDGTDAVMLSAETSIGHYPVEAVRTMDRIAQEIERHLMEEGGPPVPDVEEATDETQHALATAACMVAEHIGAAGIVPFTITGSTARYISQRRPKAPILALTPAKETFRRLALLWGVWPLMLEMFETTDEMIQQGQQRLLELDCISPGDSVVYVAGASTRTPGGADMLKIQRFPEESDSP